MSLIIPTRNRVGSLEVVLRSIMRQRLPASRFEVLVVDNGSTDTTKDVVQYYENILPNCRYVFAEKPGLHEGRHKGLEHAESDILVFADDDIRATPSWLEAIAEAFSDPKVSLVGGNNLPYLKGPAPPWLRRLWSIPSEGGRKIGQLSLLSLPPGKREISPFLVWGCNFSVRRSVVLDAGGFHPDAMPKNLIRFRGDGETHVSRYVHERGLTCVFDSRASIYHTVSQERMTFEYFRQRAFAQGISDSYTHLRNPKYGLGSPGMLKLRKTLGKVRNYIKPKFRDGELQLLIRELDASYGEGYRFHQDNYASDPEVRSWTHRQDYF